MNRQIDTEIRFKASRELQFLLDRVREAYGLEDASMQELFEALVSIACSDLELDYLEKAESPSGLLH